MLFKITCLVGAASLGLLACKTAGAGGTVRGADDAAAAAAAHPSAMLSCSDGEDQFILSSSKSGTPGSLSNPVSEKPLPLVCVPGNNETASAAGGKLLWQCTGSDQETGAVVIKALTKTNGKKSAIVYRAKADGTAGAVLLTLACKVSGTKLTCDDAEDQLIIDSAQAGADGAIGALTTPAAEGEIAFTCASGKIGAAWTCDAPSTALGTLKVVVTGKVADVQKKSETGGFTSLLTLDCQ